MAFQSGDYNRRITFESLQLVDEGGIDKEKWVAFCSVWAKKIPVSGREYNVAASTQNENKDRYVVRVTPKTKEIDESMRLVDRGKVYNIVSKINDGDNDVTFTFVTEGAAI